MSWLTHILHDVAHTLKSVLIPPIPGITPLHLPSLPGLPHKAAELLLHAHSGDPDARDRLARYAQNPSLRQYFSIVNRHLRAHPGYGNFRQEADYWRHRRAHERRYGAGLTRITGYEPRHYAGWEPYHHPHEHRWGQGWQPGYGAAPVPYDPNDPNAAAAYPGAYPHPWHHRHHPWRTGDAPPDGGDAGPPPGADPDGAPPDAAAPPPDGSSDGPPPPPPPPDGSPSEPPTFQGSPPDASAPPSDGGPPPPDGDDGGPPPGFPPDPSMAPPLPAPGAPFPLHHRHHHHHRPHPWPGYGAPPYAPPPGAYGAPPYVSPGPYVPPYVPPHLRHHYEREALRHREHAELRHREHAERAAHLRAYGAPPPIVHPGLRAYGAPPPIVHPGRWGGVVAPGPILPHPGRFDQHFGAPAAYAPPVVPSTPLAPAAAAHLAPPPLVPSHLAPPPVMPSHLAAPPAAMPAPAPLAAAPPSAAHAAHAHGAHRTAGPFLGSEIVGARFARFGAPHYGGGHFGHPYGYERRFGHYPHRPVPPPWVQPQWDGSEALLTEQDELAALSSPAGYDGPDAWTTPQSQPAPGGY